MSEPRHGNPEQPFPPPGDYPPYGQQQPYGQQYGAPGYGYPPAPYGYPQQVVMVSKRPNHVLHLILTIVTFGFWSSVWIVLTARYWGVVDYRNPAEHMGMRRRTWIAVGVLVGLNLVVGIGIGVASAAFDTTANDTLTSAAAATSAPAPPVATGTAAAKPKPKPKTTIPGDGTFEVPQDVKPGTYVTAGGDGCYWARLKDTSGSFDSIIANGDPSGQTTVTIKKTDKAFETDGCKTWHKR